MPFKLLNKLIWMIVIFFYRKILPASSVLFSNLKKIVGQLQNILKLECLILIIILNKKLFKNVE